MLIISDLHGCYWTLRRLLRKCPDELLVFAGDLVDRGPHSREVVEFAMAQRIPTVMGNHDDMMMSSLLNDRESASYDWLVNGGVATLRSYEGNVPDDVVAWMQALPVFLEYDQLLVSHTGHGLLAFDDRFSALWERDFSFPDDGRFRVFGHTQQPEPFVTSTFACIDTGAAYGGRLTALRWPSMELYQQEYDESPL